MRIPYVIDNQNHLMVHILNALLAEHKGRSLDVATAYFTVNGFGLIRAGLAELGNFRLLLGAEPTSGEQIGLRPDADNIRGLIRQDLEALPFTEQTLRLVEDLIAFLRRESVLVSSTTRVFSTPNAGCSIQTGRANKCCSTVSGRYLRSSVRQTSPRRASPRIAS